MSASYDLETFMNIPDSITLGNGIGDIKGIIEFRIWYKTRSDTNIRVVKSKDVSYMNLKYDDLKDKQEVVYIHYMAVVVTDQFEPVDKNDINAYKNYYRAVINDELTMYELLRENVIVEIPISWAANKIIPIKVDDV
jgi:hypothetical protein